MSLRENATCAQRATASAGFALAVLLTGCSSPQVETNESSSPPFIEAGDFEDIRRRGTLRILVPNLERSSYLPRTGSPLDDERELIESFAFMEVKLRRPVRMERSTTRIRFRIEMLFRMF